MISQCDEWKLPPYARCPARARLESGLRFFESIERVHYATFYLADTHTRSYTLIKVFVGYICSRRPITSMHARGGVTHRQRPHGPMGISRMRVADTDISISRRYFNFQENWCQLMGIPCVSVQQKRPVVQINHYSM